MLSTSGLSPCMTDTAVGVWTCVCNEWLNVRQCCKSALSGHWLGKRDINKVHLSYASRPCRLLASCASTKTPHYHSVIQPMLPWEPHTVDSDTGHLRSTFGFGIMPGSHSNLLPTNQGIINTTLQNTLTRVSTKSCRNAQDSRCSR